MRRGRLLSSLNHELHREAPLEPLCLYRAAFGFTLFVEACVWLPHAAELFSSEGFRIPQIAGLPAPPPVLAYLLVLALCGASLAFCAGLFTRASGFLTLLLWVYLWCLDSLTEKAAHSMAMVVLAVLLVAPSANRFSMDRLLLRKRGGPDLPGTGTIFWQQLLRVQFAQIYFFSGLAKMMNPDWVNGNVFYRVMNGRLATPLGVHVSSIDSYLLARAGGLFTILFELFVGFLLFLPPVRPFAIAAAICFHTGIQASLYVGSLGAHFIIALLLLMPSPEGAKEGIEAGLSRVSASRRRRRARP